MKHNYTKQFLLAVMILLVSLPTVFAQNANDSRVLMQGFHWDSHDAEAGGWYNHVNSIAQEIGTAGIDMIWLPPPSDAGSDEGYLPRQLSVLSNGYGIEADHIAMLTALNNAGVEPIADIVINHRVGVTNWVDFTNPTWGTWSITNGDEVWNQAPYQNMQRGNHDTGSNYDAARDVDHTNITVRNDIKTWLGQLKTAGYKGWRYDFVHGFSPSYINEYNTASSPTFSVGEDWKNKQDIQNWIDATSGSSGAFDFPTYYALKDAIKNGNYGGLSYFDNGAEQLSGLIGWSPAHSVTFVENHDTPTYDPSNNILNGGNVVQAYAYLLTHPGTPTIFWSHYFDWGVKGEINALIGIRKDNGITNTSNVSVVMSSGNVYAALIDDKVAVKVGTGSWSPAIAGWADAADYQLETSGNNYAVWVKSAPSDFTVYWKKPNNGGSAYIHHWNATPNGSAANSTWPGDAMSDASGTYGTGWYSYTFTGVSSTSVVFNNGQGSQTPDLTASATSWYDNGWVSEPSSGGFTVHFKPNSYNNPRIYFWGTSSSTSWPGESMTNDGNGWYSYTFPNDNCANIIFSNNGNNQTADLYKCGDGWYNNGWSNSASRMTNESDIIENELAIEDDFNFAVYPNPSNSGFVNVKYHLEQSQDISIKMIDVSGMVIEEVFSGKSLDGNQQLLLNTSKLNSGIYILQFNMNDEIVRKRVMIKN